MISDDTITSLRNCFKNNKIERALKSFAKNKIFKGAQKMKKWYLPLLVGSGAAFVGAFSFALLAPITFWVSVPFALEGCVLTLLLSILGVVVFKFSPAVLQEVEKIADQSNKNLMEHKEQTVALLQELHTYLLPLKTKQALNEVVACLSDSTVSSSTWSKVNQCLREIKHQCNQLVVKVKKDNTLNVSIKDLEKKFKTIDYNVMQL